MSKNYIKVAAATPTTRVASPHENAKSILSLVKRAHDEQIAILCLPELCITGYTCGDLFLQSTLLNAASKSLHWLIEKTANYNVLTIAGIPIAQNNNLYNMAAVFCKGQLLGMVPKSFIPNYGGLYELRHFTPGNANILFKCSDFTLGIEIGEDLWTPSPPSTRHALAGADIIANLSASSESIGKAEYRRSLAKGQSARLICGYIYAEAGSGESTSDLVFSGHNMICENGVLLNESLPFADDNWTVSELDMHALAHDRRRMTTFTVNPEGYTAVPFSLDIPRPSLSRFIDPSPFSRGNEEMILSIQAAGLSKRLDHIGSRCVVLGVSGGLDSTLALLVAARAEADILAVTMPCFGTTERTRKNAHALCGALGIPCREIDITESVSIHLQDIGHTSTEDITYENAQARMRTMVLMDLANQQGGIVVGTGDLSELALGWATYNGDHMSMYAVNTGVPKTLVRYIIQYAAENAPPDLQAVLTDILDTPVSPELLPGQQTEDVIGPYELHDFFLYHLMRWGRSPKSIYHLADTAFSDGKYSSEEILKWLKIFLRRFFTQQFKRNCLPDGPKIGSVSLSPRGGWRMPSDASLTLWLEELENM